MPKPHGDDHANSEGNALATRTAGLPPRRTVASGLRIPNRTTLYNAASRNGIQTYLLLRRGIDTYELAVRDPLEAATYYTSVELSPTVARRLVRNLTAALRANGHWKN